MNPVENYVRASGDMLREWSTDLDPEVRDGLNDAIAAGGALQIQTTWSRSGHLGTVLVLVGPNGDRLELAALELNIGVRQ